MKRSRWARQPRFEDFGFVGRSEIENGRLFKALSDMEQIGEGEREDMLRSRGFALSVDQSSVQLARCY
jgi:hypothetical protein